MSHIWLWAILVAACVLGLCVAFLSHADTTTRTVLIIACILNVIAMLRLIFWPHATFWPFNRKARHLTQSRKDK